MPDRFSDSDPTDLDVPDLEWDEAASRQAAALAIVNCGMCDDEGYAGSRVCDHRVRSPRAREWAMAEIRQILQKPHSVTVTKPSTQPATPERPA